MNNFRLTLDNKYPSLLSREQSSAIKGVYILLIVIGHNYIFTGATANLQMMVYLYMFHIAGFFMLPYLYGAKELSWRNIGNHAVRLLWPFLILALGFYVFNYVLIHGNSFRLSDIYQVLFKGNGFTLSHYCGFQVLWFLPSMFLTMILHDLYFYKRKIFGSVISLLALVLIINMICPMLPVVADISHVITSGPWTIRFAILYSFYGIVCREILLKVNNRKLMGGICITVALAVTFLYFNNIPTWRNPLAGSLWGRILYPATFIILIVVASAKLIKLNWLNWLGENSMLVYLIHPFIGFVLIHFFPTIYDNPLSIQIPAIVISFSIILGVTISLVVLIKRCKPIYRFLFPRNVNQWIEIWRRG